jgi:LuxR family transcriptional regulator, maltose regulon positive regulatory protein
MTQGAPRLINRKDLLAALDRAATRAVTVISAPAGSGKTTLLRAWAERPEQPRRLALLRVQRDQHDAQQFWMSLLDAVRYALGTADSAEPQAATPDFNQAAMVDRILAELADAGRSVMLVIDDVHELTWPEAFAQLSGLLTSLPPNVHAIVTTRRDVRLRLHQIRLAGELAEIRAEHLRFSERETGELLRTSGIALSEAGVRLLHQRTEGWAAGLRLAELSLVGHPDPERFVAEFSGSERTVAEYLLAEMLERQPPGVQDLLLRTSLLDRVNGELADLLTGRAGSERILLDLEDANAFVESLDAERSWFRYHRLFSDLLRLELRRAMPAEVPAFHGLAAGWLLGHGQVIDAVEHTLAAGEWADAARLLADHSFSLTLDGQAQTMQALALSFPPGEDHPELALVRAIGDLAEGRLDEAAAHLAAAQEHLRATPPDRRHRLQVAVTSLKLLLARRRGDLPGVVEQAGFLASPVSGQSIEDIALDSDLRAVGLMNLGTAEAWTLGLPEAESHLRAGAELAHEIGRPYLEVGCLAQLGFANIFRNAATPKAQAFAETRRYCREAIELAERHGWGAEPVIAPALLTLAGNLVLLGEFDEGDKLLRRAERALQTDTGPDIRLLLHQTAGMLQAGRGRHLEAVAEFSAAEQLRSQLAGSQALASQLTSWLIAAQARAGLTDQASARLAALGDDQASAGEIGNARATICLAEGDPARALTVLRDVLDGTAPVLGYVTVVEAQLLAGLAHRELGDQRAANQATGKALALAESDRVMLPFAMTGAAGLLAALPRHETAHAALLADILGVLRGSATPAKRPPPAPLVDDLTPTELRVLRYLPTNMSRPDIASELSVSPNTVSTHIRSIYSKLGVGDRSSAVRRARELRLVAAGRGW